MVLSIMPERRMKTLSTWSKNRLRAVVEIGVTHAMRDTVMGVVGTPGFREGLMSESISEDSAEGVVECALPAPKRKRAGIASDNQRLSDFRATVFEMVRLATPHGARPRRVVGEAEPAPRMLVL